jgi:hypothetical protein
MKFSPDKCEVSSITGKRNPLMFPSTLYNKELNTTDATKYLGVAISKDLFHGPVPIPLVEGMEIILEGLGII